MLFVSGFWVLYLFLSVTLPDTDTSSSVFQRGQIPAVGGPRCVLVFTVPSPQSNPLAKMPPVQDTEGEGPVLFWDLITFRPGLSIPAAWDVCISRVFAESHRFCYDLACTFGWHLVGFDSLDHCVRSTLAKIQGVHGLYCFGTWPS